MFSLLYYKCNAIQIYNSDDGPDEWERLNGKEARRKKDLSVEAWKSVVCHVTGLVAKVNFPFSTAECFNDQSKSR